MSSNPKGVKEIQEIENESLAPSQDPEDALLKPWGEVFESAVVSSEHLNDVTIPKRQDLVGKWFKEGDLGFICAQRGVGKTHLSMMLANALAGPTPHIGPWDCPGNIPVLYVDGEMPLDDIRHRDRAYLNVEAESSVQYLNHEVVFKESAREMNLADPIFQQEILSFCMNKGIKAVFFDNLSSLASGMRENDADDWEKVKPWLLRFRRAGIAVVIVHHAGRSGKPRGTSKREDDTFWVIELEDDPDESSEGARFKLRFSKNRNDPGKNQVLSWHFRPLDDGIIEPTYKILDPEEDFIELIRSGVCRCTDLADAMGWKTPRVSKLAKRLQKQGRIEIENGRYRIAG